MSTSSSWVGRIKLDPPLTKKQIKKINSFNSEKRVSGEKQYTDVSLYQSHSSLIIDPNYENNPECCLIWDECDDCNTHTYEFIKYFIDNFFIPWGINANGIMMSYDDYEIESTGIAIVKDNHFTYIEFPKITSGVIDMINNLK